MLFSVIAEREVVKIILEDTTDSSSSTDRMSSHSKKKIERFGPAHEQAFSGLNCIGIVCAQRATSTINLRCFTIHDNAMCSV